MKTRRTANLLYIATEFGFFLTIDRGAHWTEVTSNLPRLAINDFAIHPRDNDLVLATHGRGLWILDNLSALQELTPAVLASDAHLFPIERAKMIRYSNPKAHMGDMVFRGQNPPAGAIIDYYLRGAWRPACRAQRPRRRRQGIRKLEGPQGARHQPRHLGPAPRTAARTRAGVRRRRRAARRRAAWPAGGAGHLHGHAQRRWTYTAAEGRGRRGSAIDHRPCRAAAVDGEPAPARRGHQAAAALPRLSERRSSASRPSPGCRARQPGRKPRRSMSCESRSTSCRTGSAHSTARSADRRRHRQATSRRSGSI